MKHPAVGGSTAPPTPPEDFFSPLKAGEKRSKTQVLKNLGRDLREITLFKGFPPE